MAGVLGLVLGLLEARAGFEIFGLGFDHGNRKTGLRLFEHFEPPAVNYERSTLAPLTIIHYWDVHWDSICDSPITG